jgi:WD40 repeat protein
MTSAAEDELTHREQLADVLQRRLRVLEIQRARFGNLVPAAIVLELEDTEQQLARVQADLRRLRPTLADVHSPYLGLLTFQEDDSSYFFGRDALIGELLRKVEQTSFLAVLGPSGSGKSSVVRAGLIPTLKRGALPGSDQWYYLPPLKPGQRPLNSLAATLSAIDEGRLGDIASIRKTLTNNHDALLLMADGLLTGRDNRRLVLIVDQAEELWTLTPSDATNRTGFITEQQGPLIQNLLTAAAAPDQRVLIILTMRADFLHRAIEHHELAHWIGEHDVMVSPLLPEELRSVITRPAEAVGGSFEPGLVNTLLEQTIGRQGALPLLEYTLLKLWEKAQRTDGVMTWAAYDELGGVEGALAARADTILKEHYTAEQLTELRAILLRLVQPGEGAADTRRRVRIDDLVPVGNPAETVYTLLKPLADERLITTGYDPASDEETVEISHEALIGAWPTLGTWINTSRADLRLQIQLGDAVKEWSDNNENGDLLWSGLRLANIETWLKRTSPKLNERDQRFIDASRTQQQERIAAEEAARQRDLEDARALAAGAAKLAKRAVYLAAALSATLIIAALASWFWYSSTVAEQRAFAQYLVAKGQIVYEEQPLLGLRLVIEGVSWLPENDPARPDVFNITAQLAKQGRLQKLVDDAVLLHRSPDNTVFVLQHRSVPGELWRNTKSASSSITLTDTPATVDFSPDGQLVVVRYSDKPIELRRADGSLVTTLTDTLGTVQFSPNSQLVAVSSSDKPSELRRADGSLLTTLTGTPPNTVHFSADSQLEAISSSDKPIELRRADGSLIMLTGTPTIVQFSPDGQLFAVIYRDKPGELRRVDGSLLTTLTNTLATVRFSPDGQLIAVGYLDKGDELRRADGSLLTTLTDTPGAVQFSPDGQLVAVFNTNTSPQLRRADGSLLTTLTGTVGWVNFSPDSRLVVIRYIDKPNELRRADGSLLTTLTGTVGWIDFSPDSRLVVIHYSERPNELRRADGSLLTTLTGFLSGIKFSPDGQLFAVDYLDKPNELRRADGSLVTIIGNLKLVDFSPDGKLLTVSYTDKPSELWEAKYPTKYLTTFPDLGSLVYNSKEQTVIVQKNAGQVYILDIALFTIAANYPKTLSEKDFLTQICDKLFSSSQFDEKQLQPYLENRTPRGCQ